MMEAPIVEPDRYGNYNLADIVGADEWEDDRTVIFSCHEASLKDWKYPSQVKDGQRLLLVKEACDGFFGTWLTADRLDRLIAWLQARREEM